MPRKLKWNEVPCSECKEPVSVDATRCPHCQAIYSSADVDARKKIHSNSQKWGVGCVALIGVFLLGMCSFGGDKNSTHEDVSADAPLPDAGSASADVTSSVKKLNDEIMLAVKPCDEAGKSLASAAGGLGNGSTSIYDSYSAAANVERACKNSWSKMNDLDVPPALTGAVEAKAEKAIETCKNAMLAKQMGGEAMKEVFDGDMRPSKMEDAKEKTSIAQAGTLACVAGIFSTAAHAGVNLDNVIK